MKCEQRAAIYFFGILISMTQGISMYNKVLYSITVRLILKGIASITPGGKLNVVPHYWKTE